MTGSPQCGDRKRKAPFVLFCFLSLLAIVYCAIAISPIRVGDAHEYLLMAQAFSAHGSPDIRPTDIDWLIESLRQSGLLQKGQQLREHYLGDSFTATTGKIYYGHFWFYSLLAVPAFALLRFSGGNEMAALQSMNAVFFCLAAGFVLFFGRGERRERVLLLALSAIGPVIWYIRWPHPEAYTWSAALIAVVLLRQERFGWAALAASLGALQNPPLMLLALLAVVLAVSRRNWGAAAMAAAGAALSFLPALFFLVLFGVPNLFVANGYTDFALISVGRVWSLLADLNQGMLPYVPLVLLIGLFGGVMALIRGRIRGILVLVVLLGMIILVGPQKNWNAGTAGMIRYAVWMVPLLAWLAVDFVPRGRFLVWVIGAGLLLQAGIVLNHDGNADNLRQNALARVVLTHCPRLYSPDPQIFTDRQRGQELNYLAGQLPIPFATESGYVTKLLVDRQTHQRLSDYFMKIPAGAWLGEQGRERSDGLYYLNPPRHTLRVIDPEGMDPAAFRKQLRIRLVKIPQSLSVPEFEIGVEVANEGPFCYWGQGAGTPHPLKLGYLVHREGEVVSKGRTPMPFVLKPGAAVVKTMRVELPRSTGRYRLTVGALLEKRAWTDSTALLTVDCTRAEHEEFRATVVAGGQPPAAGWVE